MAETSKALTFYPCTNADFSGQGTPYVTQFNPSNLVLGLSIDRDPSQAIGNTYTQGIFKNIKPHDITFEFTIDGTGAGKPLTNKTVAAEVDAFLAVIYHYVGNDHQPYYVKAVFGSVIIKGVATGVNITYTLFANDGTPLRAKLSVTIKSTMEPELGEKKQGNSSPDLTHMITLKQSDRLISLAYPIYNNNGYYSDVANLNGFNNFRRQPVGTQIFFPPLAK